MKKIDLWRITTTKKGFIQALIFAIIGVFVLGYSFVRLTYFGLNPELNSDYLFAYGYGKYRLSFSYMVLIFFILYLVSLVLVLRKGDINVAYTGMLLFVIILFTGIGGFVVSIKEYRSLASYTNNIDNYGVYDQLVEDDSIHWSELLPLKENILSYEYTFVLFSSIFGYREALSISMSISYNQTIETNLLNDTSFVMNPSLCMVEHYNCYYKGLVDSNLKVSLYVFVSHNKEGIYYVITNQDPTRKEDKLFYVLRFINDERKSPYDN